MISLPNICKRLQVGRIIEPLTRDAVLTWSLIDENGCRRNVVILGKDEQPVPVEIARRFQVCRNARIYEVSGLRRIS